MVIGSLSIGAPEVLSEGATLEWNDKKWLGLREERRLGVRNYGRARRTEAKQSRALKKRREK